MILFKKDIDSDELKKIEEESQRQALAYITPIKEKLENAGYTVEYKFSIEKKPLVEKTKIYVFELSIFPNSISKSEAKKQFKLKRRKSNSIYRKKFGFSKKQYENFITRYNRRQDKIAAGIALKRKGRPPKDYIVSEQDKIAELKYILARKEAKIKSLEMENDLMRDFLSLTERK